MSAMDVYTDERQYTGIFEGPEKVRKENTQSDGDIQEKLVHLTMWITLYEH
jgi:hypothetical protein